MIELMLVMNARFTKEDKEACVCYVEKMIEIDETAQEHGLIAVEEEIMPLETDTFLLAALPLLLDSIVPPDEMTTVLSALILSGGYTGAQLLSRLIMAQGIVSIQNGVCPKVLRTLLYSMLGEEYLMEKIPFISKL